MVKQLWNQGKWGVLYMDIYKLVKTANQFMYRWVLLSLKIIIDNQCVWICFTIICMWLLYNNCECHFDEVGFCFVVHVPPLEVCHLLSIGHLKLKVGFILLFLLMWTIWDFICMLVNDNAHLFINSLFCYIWASCFWCL